MSYYLLTDAPNLAAGATLRQDDDEASGTDYITTNPELISFYEITGDLHLVKLLGKNADHTLRLVLLEPLGDVDPYHPPFHRCENGWTVTEVQPIDAVFGPHAQVIRNTIDQAENILNWDQDEAASGRFLKATNTNWDAIEQAQDAAEAALNAAGMNGWGWANVGGDVYGYVYVGLAARDLIGTTPEWTAEAYTTLTRPWQVAFGAPIHPGDTVSEVSK